jgi:carboxyl-terminal processing protease
VIPLNGKGALRLTTALYYTPNGRSIQGQGITPDDVVEAPKDQQIVGGLVLSENTLHGAFANPGSLGKPSQKGDDSKPAAKAAYSAPIKIDLLGTPEDAQLKAALAHIEQTTKTTNGEAQKAH